MADVQPFRGLRYNLERIGDLSAVISPPYDVISPQEQLLYHDRSPYNVIRLEFGEERPGDSDQDNKYTRAATTMRGWLGEAILVREEHPAFYLVEHHFLHQDRLRSRFSLIARVRLEELASGQIRPHETTMRRPAIDRLRLLRSCHANFSPVMGLFRGDGGLVSLFEEVAKQSPQLEARDDQGVSYRLWMVGGEERVAQLSRFFADKVIYIADGHHRYETALAYQGERRSALSSYTGREGFNFVMMTLSDADDPNLVMFPTHRLVRGIERERLEGLEAALGIYFQKRLLSPQANQSQTLKSWLDALSRKSVTFGLYGLHGQQLCLLTGEREALEKVLPDHWPRPLRELDVGLLQWVVLRQMLVLDSIEKEEDCLEYTRDGLEALSRVDSGAWQLAFLLNPAPISSVIAVADCGMRMPQKSTYFHPKTPTGLVINPLWDEG